MALRGGLQHAAPALLELLLVNERGELGGLVMDRLAVPPEQHKVSVAAGVGVGVGAGVGVGVRVRGRVGVGVSAEP